MTNLSYNPIEDVDQHEVEMVRGVCRKTDFQQIIIVGRDSETGQVAVDHEVHLLTQILGTKWFGLVEQQLLKGNNQIQSFSILRF